MEGMNVNKSIFITGATGKCGQATIKFLCDKYPQAKIMAAVRDIKKAKECFGNCKNLEFCQIDSPHTNPAACEELLRNMKGCGAMLLIPPAADRVQISKTYCTTAKKAGIEYVCTISVGCVDRRNTLFHRQFKEIEQCVLDCGLHHSFLRCEFFMENSLGDIDSIKRTKSFSNCVTPDAKYCPIATCDVGAVAGTLLIRSFGPGPYLMTSQGMGGKEMGGMTGKEMGGMGGKEMGGSMPGKEMGGSMGGSMGGKEKEMMGGKECQHCQQGQCQMHQQQHRRHHSSTYHLTGSKAISMTDLAAIYSKICKCDIKYVQVGRDVCLKRMVDMGMPQWQSEGIMELWDMVNDGMCQHPANGVEQVLDRKAMTMDEFMGQNAKLFGQ